MELRCLLLLLQRSLPPLRISEKPPAGVPAPSVRLSHQEGAAAEQNSVGASVLAVDVPRRDDRPALLIHLSQVTGFFIETNGFPAGSKLCTILIIKASPGRKH